VWDSLGSGIARPRLEELWMHSVACAMAAKSLASKLRLGDPDETFTAGLLHDVGRLVLAMRFRDDYWNAVGGTAETEPVDALERQAFGIDHAEVGGWMLEAWALPPAIVEAVRTHHSGSGRTAAGVLALTDRLVAWTDFGTGDVRPEALLLLESNADRGITADLWQNTVTQLRDNGSLSAFSLDG
jgi:putative nucleotidyltransferase with HDIG domain